MRFFLFLIVLIASSVSGQDMPNTDIYLMRANVGPDNQLMLEHMQTIANSQTYENQPYFIDEHTLVFSKYADNQTDIWQWKSGALTQLTQSEESEYSPTVIPNMPGSLSMIRVESDGTQRLWRRKATGEFELLFKSIKPVGYHVWRGNNIGLFVLGEPHRFEVTRLGHETTTVIDQNIGRGLQKVPEKRAVSYTVSGEKHTLKRYDFQSKKATVIGELPDGGQDYLWVNEQQLLATSKDKLYLGSLRDNLKWQPVTMPSNFPKGELTRIALSPSGTSIAIVVAPLESD